MRGRSCFDALVLLGQVRWGDGVVDSRSGDDFYIGDLQDEVISFGLDALTPMAPSFSTVPKGECDNASQVPRFQSPIAS